MQYILLLLIFILAGMEAEILGFGISTVSMAFLPLLLPLHVAIPLVAMVSVVATGIVAFRTKTKGLTQLLLPLFVGSALGIPLGMYFLRVVSEEALLLILGLILVLTSSYGLLNKKAKRNFSWKVGILLGLLTGFFGASVNVNGPLIGIYSTKDKRFSKFKKKDLIATYMFFTGLFMVAGHYLAGRITGSVLRYFAIVLPGLFTGLQIGKAIFKKLPAETLKIITYLFILAAGMRLMEAGIKIIF